MQSITVAVQPTKLTYKVGEDFDVKDVETALKDAGITDAQTAAETMLKLQ